jgi:hypothetical protein
MTWSILLCVPLHWSTSADVERKSIDRADVADTLKEL